MPPTPNLPSAPSLILPGDRPADVVAFESAVVEYFIGATNFLGVPKSLAAIYGIVFASPIPLSFADIEARLDISKGSVSQGLRVLREVGALTEVSRKADRAELFSPDLELRKLVMRFLKTRLRGQFNAGQDRLTHLRQTVPSPAQKELLQRLKKLQQWHDRGRALLPLVKGFLQFTPD